MTDGMENPPDFKRIFEATPGCYLILHPDAPKFTIAAVNDAYAQATNTVRENIVGKGLFEVFPDNPNDAAADGVKNLTASLNRVLESKKMDMMHIQKYDIPIRDSKTGEFEKRYWSPDNSPVLDQNGNVIYIVHHVSDVTGNELLLQKFGAKMEDARLTQLERMDKLMIDRELKMVELKKEIADLRDHKK
jgi:hypothetical protein